MLMKEHAFSQQLVDLCDICLIEGVLVKWDSKNPNEQDLEIQNSLNGNGGITEIDNVNMTERFTQLIKDGNLALVQVKGEISVFGSENVITENKSKLEDIDDVENIVVNVVQSI